MERHVAAEGADLQQTILPVKTVPEVEEFLGFFADSARMLIDCLNFSLLASWCFIRAQIIGR